MLYFSFQRTLLFSHMMDVSVQKSQLLATEVVKVQPGLEK